MPALPVPERVMSCAFDLQHYRELLDAAAAGGYRWAFFDHEPRPGDLFLRHDVDMSLDAALALAEARGTSAGSSPTYFLMTRSDFYNLGSRRRPARDPAAARARPPRRPARASHPDAALDDRFDPVVAWHTPDPEYDVRAGRRSPSTVCSRRGSTAERYRSDSNQHWRSGCPHGELARRRVRLAAAADPPRDLALPGRDDARDDAVAYRRRARASAAPRMLENRVDLS